MNVLLRFGESVFPHLLDMVWQATALMTIVLLLARALGKRRFLAGYCLRFFCLVGLLLLPITSLLYREHRMAIFPGGVGARLITKPSGLRKAARAEDNSSRLAESSRAGPQAGRSQAASEPGLTPEGPGSGSQVMSGAAGEGSPESPLAAAHRARGEELAKTASVFPWRALVGLTWIGGCAIHLLLLLFSVASAVRVRRLSSSPCNPALMELFERSKQSAGVGRKVELRLGKKFSFPFSVGILKPKILLPESLSEEMTLDELRPVLLHELAHILWKHYAVNVLERLAEAVYFFHPLVYLLNRRLRVVREEICDDWVLNHFPDANAYAKLLTTVAERWLVPRKRLIGVGLFYHWDPLSKRIERILSSTRRLPQKLHFRTAMVLLAISFLTVGALSRTSVLAKAAEVKKGGQLPKEPAKAEENPEYKLDALKDKQSDAGTAAGSGAESTAALTLRRVVKECTGYVSVSPDGKYLCDLDETSGNLVVREVATGKQWPLTKEGSWELWRWASSSAISPDNEHVAYLWCTNQDGVHELRLAQIDGSGGRALRGGEWIEPIEWSVDGKGILGIAVGPQLVWISATDGSEGRVIKPEAQPGGNVDLSPKGDYIAYNSRQKGSWDIYLLDLDGDRETPLVDHPADDKLLGWTPDNKHILFASNRRGTWDAWLLGVKDGKRQGYPELIKTQLGDVSPVRLTRDGSCYFGLKNETRQVYIVKLDLETGEVLSSPKLVRQAGPDENPDWSPDGQYLAYTARQPDESKAIRIQIIETGEERQLDGSFPNFRWLRWCAGGRSLLVTGFLWENRDTIYKVDAETGERSVLLRSGGERITAAELSRDGKTLIYGRDASRPPEGSHFAGQLVARDLETGRERVFLEGHFFPRNQMRTFALSPDDKQIAVFFYGWEKRALRIISVETGDSREILPITSDQSIHGISWMPDGKDLILARGLGVWRVSVEGGEPKKLWEWEYPLWCLKVHPDGQRITFGMWWQPTELWVMENFLPAVEASADAN